MVSLLVFHLNSSVTKKSIVTSYMFLLSLKLNARSSGHPDREARQRAGRVGYLSVCVLVTGSYLESFLVFTLLVLVQAGKARHCLLILTKY